MHFTVSFLTGGVLTIFYLNVNIQKDVYYCLFSNIQFNF